jgi:hypothetical protein
MCAREVNGFVCVLLTTNFVLQNHRQAMDDAVEKLKNNVFQSFEAFIAEFAEL